MTVLDRPGSAGKAIIVANGETGGRIGSEEMDFFENKTGQSSERWLEKYICGVVGYMEGQVGF